MPAYQHQNFSYKVWLPLLLAMVCVGGMVVGTQLQQPTIIVEEKRYNLPAGIGAGKVEELVRYIESRYVDSIDRHELLDEAIEQLLFQLDPHSVYTSPERSRLFRGQMEGKNKGLGVITTVDQDSLLILDVIASGPADRAGLESGDRLITLFDSLTVGEDFPADSIGTYLDLPEGETIRLGVDRAGSFREIELTIGDYPEPSVETSYRVDDHTAYVRLLRFGGNTVSEFHQQMVTLLEQGEINNLILDLRDNPGGYLNEATELLNQLFSERGKLLVYTEGRKTSKTEYKTNGQNKYDFERIIVLINEGSASASEIVAGALQDWDRGLLIGRRTYGKGLVQEQYELDDGSTVRLTVARYYTPSGRSIQRDYSNQEDYAHDVENRYDSGELFDGEIRSVLTDSTEFFTADGRVVHASGGITPDIFVPLDTTLYSDEFVDLERLVPVFVVNARQQKIIVVPDQWTEDEFVAQFRVTPQHMEAFQAFAKARGMDYSPSYWQRIYHDVETRIAANVGRFSFGESAYYRRLNQEDPTMRKAIQYLRIPTPLVHHIVD